jgi:metallo-beta-lactamase family protein
MLSSENDMAKIKFLGAAGTVSGSKYLIDNGETRFLVDYGMFQGPKKLRLLNWQAPPVLPGTIENVLLTHAHIDHSGMLPVLVRDGFKGKIWSTPVTAELCEISLLDAAHLQEEDARFANKMAFSKHKPALPLFTTEDAERVAPHLRPVQYGAAVEIPGGAQIRFLDAGHILGSAIIEVSLRDHGNPVRLVFSGDLGRYDALILRDPEPVNEADYLLVESTYGDRMHPAEDPVSELSAVIIQDFDDDAKAIFRKTGKCPVLCPNLEFIHTPEESQKINSMRFPAVIISASGMATGGRILHHLKHRLPDARNTILFAGYQSIGTRGQLIKDGAKAIKIHGEMVPVRAQVRSMEAFSGHADSGEIMRWLRAFKKPPRMTFVVHGEPESSAALAKEIHNSLGWKTYIPEYLESFNL